MTGEGLKPLVETACRLDGEATKARPEGCPKNPSNPKSIAEGLSEAQKRRLRLMHDGEMSASSIGAVGYDSTRIMREFNRSGMIIFREYRGGRNQYRLTPLGLLVRRQLLENSDG